MSSAATSTTAATLTSSIPFSAFSSTFSLFTPAFSEHRLPALCRRRFVAAGAASDAVEVCVKDSITSPGKLGDCPFSQRILITLEEKQLPYDMNWLI